MDKINEEKKWDYKKTHLEYQMTEFDCGPTTILNALRFLLNREDITPDIYKHIYQKTLDLKGENGKECQGGTSVTAMEELCEYLNQHSELKIQCIPLPKNQCSIYDKQLKETIQNNGVAIIRVWQTYEHYCLLTGLDDKYAYIFDPYYFDIDYYNTDDCVEIIKDKTFEYNRKVLKSRLDDNDKKDFSLVKNENQQIVLMMKKKD